MLPRLFCEDSDSRDCRCGFSCEAREGATHLVGEAGVAHPASLLFSGRPPASARRGVLSSTASTSVRSSCGSLSVRLLSCRTNSPCLEIKAKTEECVRIARAEANRSKNSSKDGELISWAESHQGHCTIRSYCPQSTVVGKTRRSPQTAGSGYLRSRRLLERSCAATAVGRQSSCFNFVLCVKLKRVRRSCNIQGGEFFEGKATYLDDLRIKF